MLDKTLLVEGQLRPMLQDDAVAELVKQVAHLGELSSSYRSCPATSPEGQASTASSLVRLQQSVLGGRGSLPCTPACLPRLAVRLALLPCPLPAPSPTYPPTPHPNPARRWACWWPWAATAPCC